MAACNRFIFIENQIVDEEAKPKIKPAEEQETPEPPTKAIPLIRKAMNAISRDDEWYSLGQLGQYIVLANPDFDARNYGSQKLSDLLSRSGKFEVKKGQGTHLIARYKSGG